MHMNMIISAIKIINKCNVNIDVYRSQLKNHKTTSHGHSMYVFLGCYLPVQPALKSLSSVCNDKSFTRCTNLSHKL